MKPSQTIPQLFTLLFFIGLFGYSIFSNGMFFDGLVYASVSNNLANGIGTFWHLSNSLTLHHEYFEQPPLVFWMQAGLFKLLGNSILIERIYCFIMAIGMVMVIAKTWILTSGERKHTFWLPCFIWCSIPIVSWTYENNLMEVTMGLFDALAILALLKGCITKNYKWIFFGSFFVFLASFCKGFQGLFPIIIPAWYLIVFRQFKLREFTRIQILTLSVPVFIYSFFYFWPTSSDFYSHYLTRRVVGSFMGIQNTTSTHFKLLEELGWQLIFPILLVVLLLSLIKFKIKYLTPSYRWSCFFLGIGLSASLPLLITLEQRVFYLTTSMPYFALALAMLIKYYPKQLEEKLNLFSSKLHFMQRGLITLLLLVIISLPFLTAAPKRDKALINDLMLLKNKISPQSIIEIHESLATNWKYYAYFQRYLQVSLDPYHKHQIYLQEKSNPQLMPRCQKMDILPLQKFEIFDCRN